MTRFDEVKIDTQVFQNGIPAAYLTPGIKEPQLMWTGPDGLQRPLRVRFTFARCVECRGLLLPEGPDRDTHAAWHARQTEGDAP